jgi:predicted regulator of amino acid metabolism with ACT domain
MNLQAWLTPLLNMGRKKKKSGRGMMWASIISVIISAIALRGMKKGQMEMPKNLLKNIAPKMGNTVDIQKFLTMKDRTVLAEFANEIAPKTNEVNQKIANNSNLNEDNSI